MNRPGLDHAELNDRRWAWAAGCWREWSDVQADWLPSAPPPTEAEHCNYRRHILGSKAGASLRGLS